MQLVIISGRSGSGKSAALHALEDLGYYAIDNLPAGLLTPLAQQAAVQNNLSRVAVSIDARNLSQDLNHFPNIMQELTADGVDVLVVYLNASAKTLMERFSATRRRHPLTRDGKLSLSEAIEQEEQLLIPLASSAGINLDTTRLSTHELRNTIAERVARKPQQSPTLLFQSFGFKNGVPLDADLIYDLRCLPNPFWDTSLRDKSGQDQEVIDFLAAQPLPQKMFTDISHFLESWLPNYKESNRSYITVALGCTGGQHRSVYLAERLGKHFEEQQPDVQIRHRDLSPSPLTS
ncbi:RNase adapter RapZ [Marinospirillum insulare]|uniref:Nucleotide-binding protein n=1 Tax=Marinospirillum insulare TaxID=217169 RepID=A0ABQ5ZZ77_9GAMM|nr:RNase adapter RapZ [Marinospirillum insulare]GLR63185.1 nucleotide-binding protein [Marinospirillum insulare]